MVQDDPARCRQGRVLTGYSGQHNRAGQGRCLNQSQYAETLAIARHVPTWLGLTLAAVGILLLAASWCITTL